MTHRHPYPDADLQEVLSRNHTAAHLLTALARATPAHSPIWDHLHVALVDTRTLLDEVAGLRAERAADRRRRADLIAAMRATLAAHAEGERDPLFYVRDELHAQQRADARRTPGGAG
ncbi:hypothetical protein [Nonomuraea endophytica]|uniref:Uncharacterized protein n=1 Tax=Nonomuraea endophytica TaxID=714136 RepID=A0A7W8ABA1_9ACTN|nr:hypothetical protein [Nonomuraea endophytica]MBB5082995.1 hypothetical protein [Nonomuraea endophytica]